MPATDALPRTPALRIGHSLPIQLNDFLINYTKILRKHTMIIGIYSDIGSTGLMHNFVHHLVLLVFVTVIIVLLAIGVREVARNHWF